MTDSPSVIRVPRSLSLSLPAPVAGGQSGAPTSQVGGRSQLTGSVESALRSFGKIFRVVIRSVPPVALACLCLWRRVTRHARGLAVEVRFSVDLEIFLILHYVSRFFGPYSRLTYLRPHPRPLAS
jgi:hypothetical protein